MMISDGDDFMVYIITYNCIQIYSDMLTGHSDGEEQFEFDWEVTFFFFSSSVSPWVSVIGRKELDILLAVNLPPA